MNIAAKNERKYPKMKRILSFMLALALALSLCGCASGEKDKQDKPTNADVTKADETSASDESTTQPSETDPVSDETTASDEPEVTTTDETEPEVTTVSEATSDPETEAVTEATTVATTVAETEAPTPTEPEYKVEEMSAKMYVTATANVRSGPATSYERLGHVDEGDAVDVTGICENGWYRIKFKGGEGFVGGSYIVKDKPIVTTAATTAAPKETEKVTQATEPVKKAIAMNEIVLENHCPNKYTRKKSNLTYAKDWREYSDGRTERKGGETYYSSVCGRDLVLNVVLPQGYNDAANKDKKYPVLYVLHGFFGHRYSMMTDDACDTVITNAIAEGVAEEMIVVYPDIFASKDSNYLEPSAFNDQKGIEAYDRFVEVIAKDLMPYMAKNYRVAEGRENTAVFGFSMGGREALAIGFTHPDKFGYIAAACPAPGLVPARDWANNHPGQFKKESDLVFDEKNKPYLLIIGAADNDGVVGSFPEEYHKILDKNKTEHLFYFVKDSGHGNPAIQSVCYNFAANIFKNN